MEGLENNIDSSVFEFGLGLENPVSNGVDSIFIKIILDSLVRQSVYEIFGKSSDEISRLLFFTVKCDFSLLTDFFPLTVQIFIL